MSMLTQISTITFSLCLHGSIIALAFALPSQETEIQEIVYRVSLAEFATPAPAAPPPKVDIPEPPEPPKPEPPEPPKPPEPEPPKVVEKVEPKKIEPKMISAKKRKDAPKKVAKAKPQPPKVVTRPVAPQAQSPMEAAPAAPRPTNYGGLQAYREDVVDQRPSISRRVSPKYPTRARRMNIQGQVIVRLIVDTSGTAQQCTIHSSNPKDVFDDAALSAAKKTRFIPGKVKGNKVNTVVLIPYQFTLR